MLLITLTETSLPWTRGNLGLAQLLEILVCPSVVFEFWKENRSRSFFSAPDILFQFFSFSKFSTIIKLCSPFLTSRHPYSHYKNILFLDANLITRFMLIRRTEMENHKTRAISSKVGKYFGTLISIHIWECGCNIYLKREK